MKLVILYGPTAVGKFTVAKELSKITGFRLFHNHLVNDMLDNILNSKKESKIYWGVADNLKLKIIEELAKRGVKGVIFTMVYVKTKDNTKLPMKLKRIVERNKGKIYFVKLESTEKDLLKRITNKSRKKFGKWTSKKGLEKLMKKHKLMEPLPFKDQLIINTTKIPARKAAKKIKNYFRS
jgi:RNase adaptor protein for sRNA GlmZ degradation